MQTGEQELEALEVHAKEVQPGQELLSKVYDYRTVFHEEGSNQLYIALKTNKGKIIAASIKDGKKKTFFQRGQKKILWLANYAVATRHTEKWTVDKIFDTLVVRFNFEVADLKANFMSVQDAMTVMCPEYDEDQFKEGHAKKLLGWYNQLITAYQEGVELQVEDMKQQEAAKEEPDAPAE